MILSQNDFILTSTSDIQQISSPLKKIHINHFAYTRSYNDGTRIYLGTSPKWLEKYFADNYHLIGNCEHAPKFYTNQTLLWSSLPKQNIYLEAREVGIKEGIFIVNPKKDYTEFCDFGTTAASINITNIFLSHYEILNNFIEYFQEKATLIIKQAKENKFTLPHLPNKAAFVDSFQSFNNTLTSKNIKLSRQQLVCAKLLLQGQSYKMIARELSLSPRTIETYIENLKSKLRVQNKAELIYGLSKYFDKKNFSEANFKIFLQE